MSFLRAIGRLFGWFVVALGAAVCAVGVVLIACGENLVCVCEAPRER